MRRLRSCLSIIGGTILLALLLVAVVGPAVGVELRGQTAAGVVTARHEDIRVRYSNWTRRLAFEVRYTPADTGQPELAIIPVSTARYDRGQIGESVQVRYLPQPGLRMLGELAATRLADQGPLGQWTARIDSAPLTFGFLAIFLVLLLAWLVTRRGWLLLPVGLLFVGFALYALSDPPQPTPPGPQLSTQARVQLAHDIDRIAASRSGQGSRALRRLLQPYTVVALEFVPQGAAGSVVAVDMVDVGSVPNLAVGSELPITYSVADPRWARIEGAQRSYFWKNLLGYAAVAALIVLLLLGLWLRRIRQRRRLQQAGSSAIPG